MTDRKEPFVSTLNRDYSGSDFIAAHYKWDSSERTYFEARKLMPELMSMANTCHIRYIGGPPLTPLEEVEVHSETAVIVAFRAGIEWARKHQHLLERRGAA